jgi:Dyp-type peroxidase family
MLYAGDKAALAALSDAHVGRLRSAGIDVLRRLDTEDLLNRTEQFGFRDGIAQPLVRGVIKEKPVTETESPESGNEVNPGEFLLGFPNAYDKLPVSPAVSVTGGTVLVDFGYCGSYLVFRQLRQDVLKFWQFLYRATERPGRSEEENLGECVKLAAKMVGRWPSGAPLELRPDKDDPSLNDADTYGFYENDRLGRRVPIGSHTRRSNPRDSLEPGPGGEGRLTREESLRVTRLHRVIRRGRPYGPPIASSMKPEDVLKVGKLIEQYEAGDVPATPPEAQVDFKKEAGRVLGKERADESMSLEEIIDTLRRTVNQDRGLHFLCFNASIARQFEFVQQTWINNPKFGGLYADNDPIMGQRHTAQGDPADTFTEQGSPVRRRFRSLPEFVTVRGGAYFFMPGIEALKYLAGLPNQLPRVDPKDLD